MYNKIILQGNLTKDIEILYAKSGTAIAKSSIAVNEKFKSNTGELKENVLFVDITFFGRTAEIANQYLKKGSKVIIDGKLNLDRWEAQDGSKRSKHSIVVSSLQMLGGTNEDNINKDTNPQSQKPSNLPPAENNNEININEDEIPF